MKIKRNPVNMKIKRILKRIFIILSKGFIFANIQSFLNIQIKGINFVA